MNRRTLLQASSLAVAGAWLGACSASTSQVADGVSRSTASFTSTAMRGTKVGYEVLLPPGRTSAQGLPLCLVLHGRGDDHRAVVNVVHLDAALATVTRQGAPPIAVVSVDGGTDAYWHRRADGDDPQAMILNELLPRLSSAGIRTSRFAMFGWSMGGYGALLLAERLGSVRVAFVAVDSPALWLHPGDSAAGAFDDAEDFTRNDVFSGRQRLAGIPVRIVCGQSDPFVTATREFAKGVPDLVAAEFPPGEHSGAFWSAAAAAQLAPLARALG